MLARLLIIDPSYFVQSQLAPYFRKRNLYVQYANTSQEAAAFILKKPPEGIILELSLPDTDGLAFAKAIRQARPNIKVMAIGSMIDKNTLTELIQVGIKNIFIKPFSIERLMETLQEPS